MDAVPYYAPTYFPGSYFYEVSASDSPSTGLMPFNSPVYFAPAYFYGPSASLPTGLLPYNTPVYFAPAYFYGPSASMPTSLLPYNTPAYFTPAYFYGPLATPVDVPVVPEPPPSPDPIPTPGPPCVVGDHKAYSALLALINATGIFEDVIFGAATQRSQAGADTYPLAVLTPQGWEESDDYDPTSIVHRVTFSITVVVKGEDDIPQFDQLDRLSFAIKKAVDGSNLDGTCLPAQTRIRSGHYVYSNHYPEQSIDLEGEFTSIIDP